MKLLIILLISALPLMAKEASSLDFFLNKSKHQEKKYVFNEYENIISGSAAFIIGNIGYLTSEGSVLKLTYTAIQTIGIINIGEGIYKANKPSVKSGFYHLLSNEKNKTISKDKIADSIMQTFAAEERAKRLSLFYSSALLSFQYFLNATIYDSPGNLKNIYIFLGGVNAIIASYSALYKKENETFYYGNNLDIYPFALKLKEQDLFGLNLAMSF